MEVHRALYELSNFLPDKGLMTNIPSTVYHYTSADALLNILQNDGIRLWYTKYDCLNDKSERKDIQRIHEKLLSELREKKVFEDVFLSELEKVRILDKINILNTEGNGEPIVYKVPEDKFLCCFSESDNILGMWRYYVKNAESKGYCIGLSKEPFVESKNDEKECLNCKRVIYSEEHKKKILLEIINRLYKEKDLSSGLNFAFNNFLSSIDLYFKNECFSDEKEIRSEISICRTNNSSKKIEFKSSKGTFIPYVEKKFPKEMLKSVTLSPLMGDDDERNLRYMLELRGYKDFKIKKSNLPIRF